MRYFLLFLLALAPFAGAQTLNVDQFSSFVVEQFQDCAAAWNQKTPKRKTATDYAHPGAPIGAVIAGMRGSGPERKRFKAFTNCFLGGIEAQRRENERETELRRESIRKFCNREIMCSSPEWQGYCREVLPADAPPLSCPDMGKAPVRLPPSMPVPGPTPSSTFQEPARAQMVAGCDMSLVGHSIRCMEGKYLWDPDWEFEWRQEGSGEGQWVRP